MLSLHGTLIGVPSQHTTEIRQLKDNSIDESMVDITSRREREPLRMSESKVNCRTRPPEAAHTPYFILNFAMTPQNVEHQASKNSGSWGFKW